MLPEGVGANDTKDADELSDLIRSWSVPGWEPFKDTLLETEWAEKLRANPDYSRCGSGAVLLGRWRSWIKSLNMDSCGVVVDVARLKAWEVAVRSSSETCEFSYLLNKILHDIPAIKNNNLRKAAAKKALDESKTKVDLGRSVLKRLDALVKNGVAHEQPAAGAGAAADAMDDAGSDEEAARAPKRLRTT